MDALFDGAHHAKDMFQTIMACSGKHELGQAQLSDASHPLQERRVEQRDLPRGEFYGAPNGIVYLFRTKFPMVRIVQSLKQR